MGTKHTGVTTLTFQVHVTSSVTCPFDSHVAISYRRSIITKSLSPAIFEIIGTKHIGVTTSTFQGYVTSSVTWPFDSQVAISFRCSSSLYIQPFWRYGHQTWPYHDLDLSGSRDIIGHVTIRLGMGHFLLVVLWTQVSISNGFRVILPQTSCSHRHNAQSSLRKRDITWCVPYVKFKYMFQFLTTNLPIHYATFIGPR